MGDGRCGALRYAEKDARSQAQGIDHRVEITFESCEGNLADVPIGEAEASSIIANKLEALGEEVAKRGPDRALPVLLEMREPGWNEYEGRSFPNPCHREIDA